MGCILHSKGRSFLTVTFSTMLHIAGLVSRSAIWKGGKVWQSVHNFWPTLHKKCLMISLCSWAFCLKLKGHCDVSRFTIYALIACTTLIKQCANGNSFRPTSVSLVTFSIGSMSFWVKIRRRKRQTTNSLIKPTQGLNCFEFCICSSLMRCWVEWCNSRKHLLMHCRRSSFMRTRTKRKTRITRSIVPAPMTARVQIGTKFTVARTRTSATPLHHQQSTASSSSPSQASSHFLSRTTIKFSLAVSS